MPHIGDVFWGGDRIPTRERTLTLKVTGTLLKYTDVVFGPIGDPAAHFINSQSIVTVQGPGPNPLSLPTCYAQSHNARGEGWLAAVSDGLGGSDTDDHQLDAVMPPSGFFEAEATFEATITYTNVRTEFLLHFLDTGVAGADGDPNYGGPAVGDVNPRALGIRFFETMKAGGTITATMTVTAAIGSATATSSSVISSDWVLPDYQALIDQELWINSNYLSPITKSISASYEEHWEHCGPSSPVVSGGGEVEVDGNTMTITTTVTGGPVNVIKTVEGLFYAQPDVRYEVTAAAYALDKPYDGDDLVLNVDGAPGGLTVPMNPTGTGSFSQRSWSAISIVDGSGSSLGSQDEWENIRTWLTSGSLAASGESADDWVTMMADRAYDGISVAHAGSTPLPDPTQFGDDWTYTWPSGVGNFEGYRFFKAVCKTPAAGQTVTLELDSDPGKTFEAKTTLADTDEELWFDLCRPIGTLPTLPELWDSRYPVRPDGLPHEDPWGWGVGRVMAFTLSASGLEVAAGSVSLERRVSCLMDAQVAFLDWELVQNGEAYAAGGGVGVVPVVQGSRAVVVTTDGRRSIIEPGSLRQLFDDGSGGLYWVYSGRNAQGLISTLNACPGFTADDSPYTPSDGWLALDGSEGANLIDGGPIYYAGWTGFVDGGGVLWDGASHASALGRELVDEASTIKLQPRYHEVCVFPAAGDVWGDSGGGYDDPTPLRVAKILRAAADGLVHGVAESDPGPDLFDDSHSLVSACDMGPLAVFRQGDLPYGAGEHDHTAELAALIGEYVGSWDDTQGFGADEATQERFNARRWHRFVGLVPPDERGTGVAVATRSDWRLAVARITSSVEVAFGWGIHTLGDWKPTTFVAGSVALAWDVEGAAKRLFLVTEESGAIVLRHSDDEGASWSGGMTVAAGPGLKFPAIAVLPGGVLCVYWTTVTEVKGHIYDSSLSPMTSEFTAQASAEQSGLAAAATRGPGGQAKVVMGHIDGGAAVLTESDNGQVFV